MVSQKVKIRPSSNEINSACSINEYKFLAKLIVVILGT